MKKLCFVSLILSAVFSQWTPEPENPVIVGTGIQPQLAALSDGSVFIAWLSESSFHVYLQLLDPEGIPQFAPEGLLISDHPNNSWIAIFHLNLVSDSQGNAILSFVDTRAGAWSVFAYKISPDGEFMWGDDGIQLSTGPEDNISPRLTLLDDDAVVISWCEDYAIVHAQKITPDGIPAWDNAGLMLVDFDAALLNPATIRSDDGAVVLRWIRQTGPFWAPASELMLQKYDTDGNPLWSNPTAVSGPVSFPMGNWSQQLVTDGVNGTYSAWTVLTGTTQSAFSQAVDADGDPGWGAGTELSSASDHFRMNPVIATAAETHEMIAAWTVANEPQTQHGISGQRLSIGGDRLWGDSGLPVVQLNNQYDYLDLSIASVGEEAVVVYLQQMSTLQGDLFATRLDVDGNFSWAPSTVQLTTSDNGKSDAVIQKGPGCVFVAWSEAGQIRAHCLHTDGTLGAPVIENDCVPTGDVNDDGDLNILDIVTVVNFILGVQYPTSDQVCAGDLNTDGDLNILDIVMMLNLILGE